MRSCNELPTSAPLENKPESGGQVALDWSYLHPSDAFCLLGEAGQTERLPGVC